MNWYKRAKTKDSLQKHASMSVYVEGFDYPTRLYTVLELCHYLAHSTWKEMQDILSKEEMENWRENGAHSDFYAPDGNDYNQPIGIINNYVKAFPPGKIQWLIQKTLQVLKDIKVRVSEVKYDTFKDSPDLRVVRYVISQNPNANSKADIPLDMNCTGSTATIICKLLTGGCDNGCTIGANDAITRIDEISEWDKLHEALQGVGITLPTPDSMNGILERLTITRKVAQWAASHGYKNIYFA